MMKSNSESSRRFFIKQIAASTAGIAIGTNVLGKNNRSILSKNMEEPLGSQFIPFTRANKPVSIDSGSGDGITWNTFRGHFKMSFKLDPAVENWNVAKRENPLLPSGEYTSGDYLLTIRENGGLNRTSLINYELRRTGANPFRVIECLIECKTSYSGVYKIFTPGMIVQQNYHVDLPFHINDIANAENNQPVVWMQQTDGRNIFTFGLLDQIAITTIEGSTYDTSNGGEAPGIANSYVRIGMKKSTNKESDTTLFKDTLYTNADPDISWFEALLAYSVAVDVARDFKGYKMSEWALNPMWHSWYAHADQIDEKKIRDDAIRAHVLGVRTIEIDAGWNIPPEVPYSFDSDGDYEFDKVRFPDPNGMINAMHSMDQRVILHVAPLLMGKDCKTWPLMKDCMIIVDGKRSAFLDPRIKKVHDYLLNSWEKMFINYKIDGLWYDFLEIPARPDKPASGNEIISDDVHVAYTKLMQELYNKAIALNPNAVIILRRTFANLNSKTFCTHVWPNDTPQDYNMNRRDIVYMKTFGSGVLTHACCTSWAISESDTNVARQMASIVFAGVPAFSVILSESPAKHNAIIKAWLSFYELNKHELVLGQMVPLLPTPPSAAVRIESKNQAFFGFFEAIPGLIETTKPVNKIVIVNAFKKRTVTRLEGVKGVWQVHMYNQVWEREGISNMVLNTDSKNGLNLDVNGSSDCHVIILTKQSS
ncbi:MAG TPA: hypothetical protein DIT07_11550 [Sphingobacteriaceae bacterium]|nr:hypothetical protein [Sphingobacteriaceae bacterium]